MPVPTVFAVKDTAEKVNLTFDFTSLLGAETISIATCAVTVVFGTDATPNAILNGATVIAAGVV